MLDYKKLGLQFTKLLKEVTAEDIDAWLTFDEQREKLQRLKAGKPITINCSAILFTPKIKTKNLQKYTASSFYFNDSYATTRI